MCHSVRRKRLMYVDRCIKNLLLPAYYSPVQSQKLGKKKTSQVPRLNTFFACN